MLFLLPWGRWVIKNLLFFRKDMTGYCKIHNAKETAAILLCHKMEFILPEAAGTALWLRTWVALAKDPSSELSITLAQEHGFHIHCTHKLKPTLRHTLIYISESKSHTLKLVCSFSQLDFNTCRVTLPSPGLQPSAIPGLKWPLSDSPMLLTFSDATSEWEHMCLAYFT